MGRETYGVPITSLHEIVRVPEITAVPDAPDYLEGVINLRGKIVSVIDLRKRFGSKSSARTKHNRILVVEHQGQLVRIDRGLGIGSAQDSGERRGTPQPYSGRRTELRHRPGQVQRPTDRAARYGQVADMYSGSWQNQGDRLKTPPRHESARRQR